MFIKLVKSFNEPAAVHCVAGKQTYANNLYKNRADGKLCKYRKDTMFDSLLLESVAIHILYCQGMRKGGKIYKHFCIPENVCLGNPTFFFIFEN